MDANRAVNLNEVIQRVEELAIWTERREYSGDEGLKRMVAYAELAEKCPKMAAALKLATQHLDRIESLSRIETLDHEARIAKDALDKIDAIFNDGNDAGDGGEG